MKYDAIKNTMRYIQRLEREVDELRRKNADLMRQLEEIRNDKNNSNANSRG